MTELKTGHKQGASDMEFGHGSGAQVKTLVMKWKCINNSK